MKIYLLDRNKEMTEAWKKYFSEDNVEIVNVDFKNFMTSHKDIDTIVSPANSFGLMDGGYDKAITDYFGEQLMKDVQNKIIKEYYGEQPVGTSFSVPFLRKLSFTYPNTHIAQYYFKSMTLIHTPTMRTPEIINDSRIIYQCMRTTLIEAKSNGAENIVIPAFGGATGRVDYDEIAKMMFLAYKQVNNPPKDISWGYAWHIANELR